MAVVDRRTMGLVALGLIAAAAAGMLAAKHVGGAVVTGALAVSLGLALVVVVWHVRVSWSTSAALVLTIFSGKWQTLGFPPFFAPDRLLLALVIVTVALRGPGARDLPAIEFRREHWILLVLAIYGTASAALAGTLLQNPGGYRVLDRLGIVPFLIFLLAPAIFHTAAHRRVLVWTLVGLGAYLSVTALLETTGPHALVFPKYILDPHLLVHYGRARGPFVQAAVNGMAMYACAMCCVLAWPMARRTITRVALGGIVVLCALGLLFTLQRSIWLGAAVTFLLTVLLVREIRRFAVPIAVTGVLLFATALAVVPGLQDKVTARRTQTATVWDRQNYNSAALNMLAERPLFGFGYSTFEREAAEHYSLGATYPLTVHQGVPAHDVFASNLAELGLLGTGLWISGLVACLVVPLLGPVAPGGRPWRVVLASLLLLYTVVALVSPLADVFPNLLLWLIGGVFVQFASR